jgi:DNA-binding XRE family transcriptional regulator
LGHWAGCGYSISCSNNYQGGDEMNINLKEFRKENGLTQADMARKLDISIGTYRNWEMEVINPNEENKKKLEELIEKYN